MTSQRKVKYNTAKQRHRYQGKSKTFGCPKHHVSAKCNAFGTPLGDSSNHTLLARRRPCGLSGFDDNDAIKESRRL